MTTNYSKGRAKEYRLRNKYKKDGYDEVLRMSGSHGFSDLIAINKKKKEIIFIQSKPKKFSKKQKEELEKKHNWINDEFFCKFIVE